MKYRLGFVSNSSSSSFILGIPKGRDKIKMVIEVDLNELSDGKIATKDELLEYYKREYELSSEQAILDNEYHKEEYQMILKIIKGGGIIIYGVVSSDADNPISSYIYRQGFNDSKEYKIIKDPRCN